MSHNKFWVICLVLFLAQSSLNAQSKRKVPAKKGTAVKVSTSNKPYLQPGSNERIIEITTDYGVMIARLYDSTPLHRDNFVKLVEQHFFDSLLFHRIIPEFMIQGGDPMSKNATAGEALGGGSAPGERIPAEFRPYLFHKKGALAAARDENPGKASSNCQFYIVEGKTLNNQELSDMYTKRIAAANPDFHYTSAQKEIYQRIGGTPFLDQNYTVFGEVISGLEIIDKIAAQPRDAANRPIQDVRMTIRLLN